jgi:hypothetical protein
MSPIYAARIARNKAESAWRAVDRDASSTMEQRTEARRGYERAKASYRATLKQQRQRPSQ